MFPQPSATAASAPCPDDRLAAIVADLSARLDRAEGRARRSERRFRAAGAVLVAAITVAIVAPVVSPAVAQGYGVTLATLNTRLTASEDKVVVLQDDIKALQIKTASMSALTDPNTSQPTVRFSNVNVQVVSGSGRTEGPVNGRGNLIVGYNEARTNVNVRTGSHNLVVGTLNNYSSVGGVVFGNANTISGIQAFVLGGYQNTASGVQSSIYGGYFNTANAFYANIPGGYFNTASGASSSVSGGFNNTVSGAYSSVSGGYNITQSAFFGWGAGGNGGAGTYHAP